MRRAPILVVAAIVLSASALMSIAPVSPVAAADPVIAAAGDYGCDPLDPHYNNGDGTLAPDYCQQKVTSDQLVAGNYSAVLALGDEHYCGSLAEYQQDYDPRWGRVKSTTYPIPGNHEYLTGGGSYSTIGCDETNAGAAGYFAYFGDRAGKPSASWYSFDVGAWHLIALNSNCSKIGGCGSGSEEALWLAADLAAHRNSCLLAYWHVPLFSSGGRASSMTGYLYQLLYDAHADVVLNGHDHIYERFAPQDPNGLPDPEGITEFVVGTGGANHTSIQAVAANSVVRDSSSFGILQLELHDLSYSWSFLPAIGSFTDSGSASCHTSGQPTPEPSGATMTLTPTADSYTDASQPSNNYGHSTALRADATPVQRDFLQFNLSGVQGYVASAVLRLFANTNQGTGFDAFSVPDSNWTEMSITDANAPPFGPKVAGSGRVTGGSWVNLNVTSAVSGNGTVSFGLSTTSGVSLSLSSREGANPPQLVLVLVDSTPTVGPSRTPVQTPPATPMVTPEPGSTTFFPIADSYVDVSKPTSNYGMASSLRVDASPAVSSYLRFNVAGLSGTVATAVLRIYAVSSQATGFDVFGVADNSWTEDGINGGNAPPLGTRLGSSGRVNSGTWLAVTVTAFVTGDGLVSFGLSTTSSTALLLSSRQGVNSPQLIVTLVSPTPVPTATPIPTPTPLPTAGSVTLLATADSYLDASAPTTNYGTLTSLRVDGSPMVTSYLRFDVSGVPGTVTSAVLRMFANSSQSIGYEVYSVSDAGWSESGITNANSPSLGIRLGSSGSVSSGTWLEVTVTGAVSGNGSISFALRTTSATALSLSSREGSHPPELIVTFVP